MKKTLIAATVATKGGVGKTSINQALAGICADAGLRVLIIDSDPQPTASSYLDLTDQAPGGFHQLIAQGDTVLQNIISKTALENLDVLVSNHPGQSLENILLQAPDGRIRLRNHRHIFSDYDLVLIDTQGARSVIVEMAILASDLVISPIPPQMLAAREFHRGTGQLFADLKPYENLGIPVPLCKVVINMMDRTNDAQLLSKNIRSMFSDDKQFSVTEAVIPTAQVFRDSATSSVPLHRYEYRNSSNREAGSALEFTRALAVELFPQWSTQLEALTVEKVAKLVRGAKS